MSNNENEWPYGQEALDDIRLKNKRLDFYFKLEDIRSSSEDGENDRVRAFLEEVKDIEKNIKDIESKYVAVVDEKFWDLMMSKEEEGEDDE